MSQATPQPAGAFRLDAYLERIGVGARPSPAEVHRAHVASIPFENLDPHRGVPVSLDRAALQDKLIDRQRGGYCFEHNLVLAEALRALGAEVDPMLARVRVGRRPGTPRPRTHLVLRVSYDGVVWLADAGFGHGTLQEPIPFGPGDVDEQSGWRFRIVAEGAEHVLQTAGRDGWHDLYSFVPDPVPEVDIETSNWFTSTFPRSPFVTGLVVSLQKQEGTRVSLSDWDRLTLVEETAAERTMFPIVREQIPELLAQRFGLPGFTLDDDGRVALAEPRD
jgi:N-hydroxyarylamine O-acetyltransferase